MRTLNLKPLPLVMFKLQEEVVFEHVVSNTHIFTFANGKLSITLNCDPEDPVNILTPAYPWQVTAGGPRVSLPLPLIACLQSTRPEGLEFARGASVSSGVSPEARSQFRCHRINWFSLATNYPWRTSLEPRVTAVTTIMAGVCMCGRVRRKRKFVCVCLLGESEHGGG